jgi:glycosyltransferase involved in cell wall biosynthesis
VRVGLDGRALQPGFKGHLGRGIGLYAAELLRALAARGEADLLLYLDPRLPVAEELLLPGVERAWYPRAPWKLPMHAHLSTQLLLPSALARAPVDVFHFLAHGDAPMQLPPRTVVTVHDLILDVLPQLYAHEKPLRYRAGRVLERPVFERAELLIADSEATRDDLVRLMSVPAGRVRVVPLGVATRFRPHTPQETAAVRARLKLERTYLLYVGGIDPRKNAPRLIEAWARLRARRATTPDLVLAGAIERDEHFPALLAQARALGVGDALRVPGFVPDEDLPALISAAEAFVFPSLYEGFGLPPLEAMACGTPVVASRAGSLAEVLGEAALLVAPEDPGALADALAHLLDDGALRTTLRQRGLAQAAKFTWERTARQTIETYREVRDRTRRPAP